MAWPDFACNPPGVLVIDANCNLPNRFVAKSLQVFARFGKPGGTVTTFLALQDRGIFDAKLIPTRALSDRLKQIVMWNFRPDVIEQFNVRYGKHETIASSLGLGDSGMSVKSYRQSTNAGELSRRPGPGSNLKSIATKNQNDQA
jgi:hypothetical protein